MQETLYPLRMGEAHLWRFDNNNKSDLYFID